MVRVWERVEAPVKTPGPLCHISGLPGVPGCHILEASWNVLVGLSAPICLELVCSVRPGVLVSAAYCVSLLFAHHFQP